MAGIFRIGFDAATGRREKRVLLAISYLWVVSQNNCVVQDCNDVSDNRERVV